MFHKPRLIKIYTSRVYVYLLRSIFIMIALYFATELYEILQNELVIRRGKIHTKVDSTLFYWTEVFKNFCLMVANIYFVFVFRIGKNEKLINDDVVAKNDSTKTD